MEASIIRKLGRLLLVTVPGSLTDSQVVELKRSAIASIRRFDSEWVVLDFSEVVVCDSFFGRFVHSIAESARLLGASVVVCGLSDAVVETLVEMGFDLSTVRTELDLDAALELAQVRRDEESTQTQLERTDIPSGDSAHG